MRGKPVAPIKDTAPEAERVWVDVHRRMPAGRKWLRLGELFRTARVLHAAGVLLRRPGCTREEIHRAWLTETLGFHPPGPVKGPVVEENRASLQAVREVVRVLDGLGIA